MGILWSCCNIEDVIQHKNPTDIGKFGLLTNEMPFVMCCSSNIVISGLSLLVDQGFSAEGITYSNVSGGAFPSQKTQFSHGLGYFDFFSP